MLEMHSQTLILRKFAKVDPPEPPPMQVGFDPLSYSPPARGLCCLVQAFGFWCPPPINNPSGSSPACLKYQSGFDCCVALPHDATGLSAVCECDIS